jgi:hypothetical protein
MRDLLIWLKMGKGGIGEEEKNSFTLERERNYIKTI